MSNLTDIAKAVRDEINAATLSLTATAEFTRIPEYDTEATSDLKIFVIGAGQTISADSRSTYSETFTVNVGIMKRIADDTELDGLDDFRQEVLDLLKEKYRLTTFADAALVGIVNDPVYDPVALDSKQTYVSGVSLTYQLLS